MRRLFRRPKPIPMVPSKKSHHHAECTLAADCKADGWCFGQTCNIVRPESDGLGAAASGRCRSCRTRIFNAEAAKRADLTARHPEGL